MKSSDHTREIDYYYRPPKKRKGYFQLSTLVLFGFSSAFFPRVLTLLKFPSIINLAHLAIIPWLCIFILLKSKVKDRQQIAIVQELTIAVIIFFCVNIASAILNNAGLINACLNFLFFCEHFLLLIAIICLPLTPEKLLRFRAFIIFSSFTNTIFAYVQRYVLNLHLRQGLADNIKGVFIGGGAGHVVGASVALTFGVYYFSAAKKIPILFRAAVAMATFWHMNMADAKQALLVFGVAGIILLISKFQNIVEALKYITGGTIFAYVFFWAVENVEALGGFQTWMRPEIYGPEGEATLLKTATFRIVPTFYDSPLHPLLGLGPGHTVGRLGGWMLREYDSLLRPLGSTEHPASIAVWQAVGDSWLGDQSSMFSPLFGWAGIWGDVGWLGLISFLYIWWVVWRRLCFDDISRLLALTPLVFGLVFTQMEEPGYMLYVASIIGLRWQEYHCQKQNQVSEVVAPQQINKRPKSLKDVFQIVLLLK
ncbi:hypothetical protein [Lyngbya sp. PCC 8106]|uniref:hypothetical protein n=1 Tax=Lyngbya sp. (strain PCC 8106) TaxID=313612 RepID=UPI0000EACE04|nr:hypothetical protein [Lyngbya sp. PCC 8106]EAW35498.1 hypothetical protein L8106_10522 [Lyngbya sp. PCC 8106]